MQSFQVDQVWVYPERFICVLQYLCWITNIKNSKIEKNINFRLWKEMKSIPKYDCQARCQAPKAFYSGAPMLSIPAEKQLILHPGKAIQSFKIVSLNF
jgi:hypothetical protein